MKRISSNFFMDKQKTALLGFLGGFVVYAVTAGDKLLRTLHNFDSIDSKSLPVLVFPVVFAGVAYGQLRELRGLVEEVYDCGDSLLIKNAGQEERVPLASIANVSEKNPQTIALRLDKPGKFGSEVSFRLAKPTLFGGAANRSKQQIAKDLIARVGKARAARTSA